jgi:hypothetical protein
MMLRVGSGKNPFFEIGPGFGMTESWVFSRSQCMVVLSAITFSQKNSHFTTFYLNLSHLTKINLLHFTYSKK